MAVQSRHSPTAVVSPGTAAYYAIRILRVIAFILLIMSTFGNYITFIGGWDAFRWSWSRPIASLQAVVWPMAIAAVVYQGTFSALQWGMKALRYWLVYGIALLASAIPSFLTYNAWAGPFLSAQIGVFFAGTIVLVASVGADALPEWVLVG